MKRPTLTCDIVESLVANRFGLHVTRQRTLNSYDDVNVHVHVADDTENKHLSSVSKDGYVLKVLNTVDSQKADFVGAMHGAIEHVRCDGIITPGPVPTTDGHMFTMETLDTDTGRADFLVRLFEYIPGDVLTDKPYTPQLCYQVGQLAGNISAALGDFMHPALENHSRHWSLRNVATLEDKTDSIMDSSNRKLAKDVAEQFRSNVLAKTEKLQKGAIHADLNEGNILVRVDNNLPPDDKYCVHGVLDFGDLVYEYHVFEVAIAMAYIMIESKHGLPPLEAAGHTLAGYLSKTRLPDFDCCVVKECVAARLAQSLTYGAYEHKLDPTNTYCLHTSKRGWPLLKELWSLPHQELYKRWEKIIKSYNIDTSFTKLASS